MLPDMIVLGAPKCGTTSIHRYLEQHPCVGLPSKKELHYFSRPYILENMAGPGDKYALDGCPASKEEYERCFSACVGKDKLIDVSPSYFSNPECLSDISMMLPDVKVVVILRNPIEKAFSQYMHLVRESRETESFEVAIEKEGERQRMGYSDFWAYTSSSKYCNTIRKIFATFGKDKVLVLFQEDLKVDPQSVVNKVFHFCGLPHHDIDSTVEYNKSGVPKSLFISKITSPGPFLKIAKKIVPYSVGAKLKSLIQDANTGDKLQLSDSTRRRLRNLFDEDVAELKNLLDVNLPWKDFDE